ncbi:MAG: hypothetical protein NVSMB62_15950 [Acidobacteriaceae bacterium]
MLSLAYCCGLQPRRAWAGQTYVHIGDLAEPHHNNKRLLCPVLRIRRGDKESVVTGGQAHQEKLAMRSGKRLLIQATIY